MEGDIDNGSGTRFPLARGTPRWIAALWGVAIAAVALGARRPGLTLTASAVLTSAFFRDPERPPRETGILAPADGIVTRVSRLPDGRVRVATVMTPWDVHVNRSPIDGVVRSVVHRPGAKRPAFDKDSDRNERLEWVIDTPRGELGLVQIAGAFARRIVPYVGPPQTVGRGQRIGLIRFGSRVDVVLPLGVEPCVHVRQRVRAGTTRIAVPD